MQNFANNFWIPPAAVAAGFGTDYEAREYEEWNPETEDYDGPTRQLGIPVSSLLNTFEDSQELGPKFESLRHLDDETLKNLIRYDEDDEPEPALTREELLEKVEQGSSDAYASGDVSTWHPITEISRGILTADNAAKLSDADLKMFAVGFGVDPEASREQMVLDMVTIQLQILLRASKVAPGIPYFYEARAFHPVMDLMKRLRADIDKLGPVVAVQMTDLYDAL